MVNFIDIDHLYNKVYLLYKPKSQKKVWKNDPNIVVSSFISYRCRFFGFQKCRYYISISILIHNSLSISKIPNKALLCEI